MAPGSCSRRWLPVKPLEPARKLLALTLDERWPRSVNPVSRSANPDRRFRAG